MNHKNRLLLGQGILTMIIIISLGLIIVNEKGNYLLKNKADKEINNYLETTYQELLPNLNTEKTISKNNRFTKKVVSKANNHHYFYVYYDKKELKDSYQSDYKEGKSILNHINNILEKEIKDKTNISCTIQSSTTLDQYSSTVKDRILKEENLLELKIYIIQKELTIEDWNNKEITNQIKNIIRKMKDNNITPKYYEITITNKNDITTAIKISNITEEFLEGPQGESIIEDILNKKELKESKITYQYQN